VKLLFFIKKRQLVAEIGDRRVYRVVEGGHVPVHRKLYPTLGEELQDKEGILSILSVLASGQMYYSYEHDLTNNMQRLVAGGQTSACSEHDEEHLLRPHYDGANRNFWWNERLLEPFLKAPSCHEFIIPMICGYVGHLPAMLPIRGSYFNQRHTNYNSGEALNSSGRPESPISDTSELEVEVDILLISRMHRRRAGTRYTRRGLDDFGNAANFVETELVVMTEHQVASFVQVRGSVPWLWKQETDLSYKPLIDIEVEYSK
jgi:hypothetical protein